MNGDTPQRMVLGQVLDRRAAASPGEVFLDFSGETEVTCSQLSECSSRYANGFLASGIRKGSKVAVMMSNCPEYLYCWFGLAKIGAVMVPINTAHKGELLRYVIESSDSEAIITDLALLDRVLEAAGGLAQIKHLFVRGRDCGSGSGALRPEPLLELAEAPAG